MTGSGAIAVSGNLLSEAVAPEPDRPVWANRAAELLARDLWSAAELAELAVPELPSTKRRIEVAPIRRTV